jgi:hypothetical protein
MDMVVRSRREWDSLSPRICGSCTNDPLKGVDFQRQLVVVTALGERATGGYGILLENARWVDQQVEVVVREEVPGRSCLATMMTTQPVDIATLPRMTQKIVFRHYSSKRDCS